MRPGNVAELSFDSAAVCDYLALLYKNTLRAQEMRPASREEERRLSSSRLTHCTSNRPRPPQSITMAHVFFLLALMQTSPDK